MPKISPVSIYMQDGGEINQKLVFHAVQNDNYKFRNNIQTNKVEDGSNVTDHIEKSPIQISFTGVISNFPIAGDNDIEIPENEGFLVDFLKDKFSWIYQKEETKLNKDYFRESENKVEEAKEILREIREKRLLVSVVTPDESFVNMALTNLSYNGMSHALIVSLLFEEITIVNMKSEEIPKDFISEELQHTNNKEKKKGRTDKTEATENQKKQVEQSDSEAAKTDKEEKGQKVSWLYKTFTGESWGD